MSMSKFNEYKGLNLPNIAKQVLDKWEENNNNSINSAVTAWRKQSLS